MYIENMSSTFENIKYYKLKTYRVLAKKSILEKYRVLLNRVLSKKYSKLVKYIVL
jgi:hypothetical protein